MRITGYKTDRRTVVVANNRAEVLLVVPPGEIWEYERMTVRCTSATASLVRVYVGSESDENLVDGSNSGSLDFSDNASPIRVGPGEVLRVLWSTTPDNGSVCSFNGQRVVRAAVDDTTREYDPKVPTEPLKTPESSSRKVTRPWGGGW